MIDGEEKKIITVDCGSFTVGLTRLQNIYTLNLLIKDVQKIQPFFLEFFINDTLIVPNKIISNDRVIVEPDSRIEVEDSVKLEFWYRPLIQPPDNKIIVDFNNFIFCDDEPINIYPLKIK